MVVKDMEKEPLLCDLGHDTSPLLVKVLIMAPTL